MHNDYIKIDEKTHLAVVEHIAAAFELIKQNSEVKTSLDIVSVFSQMYGEALCHPFIEASKGLSEKEKEESVARLKLLVFSSIKMGFDYMKKSYELEKIKSN